MDLLKKIALAASMFLAASAANAATYDLHYYANEDDSVSAAFNVNYDELNQDNEFTDYFTFIYHTDTSIDILFTAQEDHVEAFTEISVTDGDGNTIYGETGSFGSFELAIFDEDSTNNGNHLASGEYTIALTGIVEQDAEAASYTLDASPIAAVPEPSTYALMIAGLGLVGFMARRRKVA